MDEGNTLLSGAMLLQQQITETLFETIDFAQDGKFLKVGLQLGALLRFEVVAMASHQ